MQQFISGQRLKIERYKHRLERIQEPLLSGTRSKQDTGKGKPALIIVTGGALREVVYALFKELECAEIYQVNRDVEEVADLPKTHKTMFQIQYLNNLN
jgi:hypothetical protein